MIDHVIVTVELINDDFCVDMELPSKLQIKDLEIQLLENLRVISAKKFAGVERITLSHNKTRLIPTDTLESSCVWDGSIIKILT